MCSNRALIIGLFVTYKALSVISLWYIGQFMYLLSSLYGALECEYSGDCW
jgi:hypothetical protein